MNKLYKCKVCGFVLKNKTLPDLCPACGFKGKIFEEFEPTISAKRRKALEMHAHSAIVHFPIAVMLLSPVLPLPVATYRIRRRLPAAGAVR